MCLSEVTLAIMICAWSTFTFSSAFQHYLPYSSLLVKRSIFKWFGHFGFCFIERWSRHMKQNVGAVPQFVRYTYMQAYSWICNCRSFSISIFFLIAHLYLSDCDVFLEENFMLEFLQATYRRWPFKYSEYNNVTIKQLRFENLLFQRVLGMNTLLTSLSDLHPCFLNSWTSLGNNRALLMLQE